MAVAISRTANPDGVAASSTIATYEDAAIGDAAADRIVVVVVGTELASSTPSAVTIDGVAMTAQSTTGNFGALYTRIFYKFWPTGTTADIAVTFSATSPGNTANHIAVYKVTGASDTLSAQGGDGTTDAQDDLATTGSTTIPADGGMIGVFAGATDTTARTWTNWTEDLDVDAGTFRFSTATYTTAGTATRTVSGANNEDAALSWVIFASGVPQQPPTVVLNSPADASSDSDTTPTLDFTGTDANGDSIEYQVQVDTVNTFDSGAPVTIDSYNGSFDNGDLLSSVNNDLVGQSFTGDGSSIVAAEFTLGSDSGTATGTLQAQIFAHTGTFGSTGTPTGSALATSDNFDASTLPTFPSKTSARFTFSGGNQITLTNGTHYFLVLKFTTLTGKIDVWYDSTSPTGAGNAAFHVVSWSAQSTNDYWFNVYSSLGFPLIDATSASGGHDAAQFSGSPDNTDPYTSGQAVTFTVPAGETLSASTTYYWRVRGKDPSGTNTFGAWSATRSFEVIEEGDDHTLVTQDIANALTIDATTITQNHVIASVDSALALSMDNTTISQNHVIEVQDIALSLTEDNATITENHNLTVADIALALTEDNTTVAETNFVLTTQDILLSLSEDSTSITQNHVLAVQDILLSLTEDNTSISQNHNILTDDILLSLTTDNTTIDQTNFVLTVQDIALALSEDNTTITQDHILAVQDILLSLTTDETTLTQNHVVTVQDILLNLLLDNTTVEEGVITIESNDIALALTTDDTTISQIHSLTVQDILLSLTTDETTVDEGAVLLVADIALALNTDNATIAQNHIVETQDMALSLTLDSTTITLIYTLAPNDIALSLSEDETTIAQVHNLTVDDVLLSLAVDNTTITQNHILSAADLLLGLTTDSTTLGLNNNIEPNDIALTLSEDNSTVAEIYNLIVSDLLHSLSIDNSAVVNTNHFLATEDIALALQLEKALIYRYLDSWELSDSQDWYENAPEPFTEVDNTPFSQADTSNWYTKDNNGWN